MLEDRSVFFPTVFDPTKETLPNQVSRVVHLKLTWIFLQGFALLTHSQAPSRLVQTTAEDVFIHVKLLHQKYTPWRKDRQKDKNKNLTIIFCSFYPDFFYQNLKN